MKAREKSYPSQRNQPTETVRSLLTRLAAWSTGKNFTISPDLTKPANTVAWTTLSRLRSMTDQTRNGLLRYSTYSTPTMLPPHSSLWEPKRADTHGCCSAFTGRGMRSVTIYGRILTSVHFHPGS